MPGMTLEQYLSETGETDAAFGARVGLSQSHVSRLRRLASRPSWSAIYAILEATGGRVTETDWRKREPV